MQRRQIKFLAVVGFLIASAYWLTYSPTQSKTYESSAGTKPAQTKNDRPLKIILGGDVMLGRSVETLSRKSEYGYNYPFQKLKEIFKERDLVCLNLEGPITYGHEQTPNGGYKFSFEPEVANVLKENNVNCLSLGNNHSLDMGHQGLSDTRNILSGKSISFAGDSTNEPAWLYTRIPNTNVVMYSFNTTWTGSWSLEEAILVLNNKSSVGNLDLVMIHWGEEYSTQNNLDQEIIARSLIDAGADMIVGHHPHVVQPIEIYKNKLIAYSLGNLIFDQYFSKDVQEGLLLDLIVDYKKITVNLLPVKSVRSVPEVMTPEEQIEFLEVFYSKLNSKIIDKPNNNSTISVDYE